MYVCMCFKVASIIQELESAVVNGDDNYGDDKNSNESGGKNDGGNDGKQAQLEALQEEMKKLQLSQQQNARLKIKASRAALKKDSEQALETSKLKKELAKSSDRLKKEQEAIHAAAIESADLMLQIQQIDKEKQEMKNKLEQEARAHSAAVKELTKEAQPAEGITKKEVEELRCKITELEEQLKVTVDQHEGLCMCLQNEIEEERGKCRQKDRELETKVCMNKRTFIYNYTISTLHLCICSRLCVYL